MLNDLIHQCDDKMKKSIHALEEHLGTLRTGRASTKVFEELEVEAYGTKQPMRNIATIATPDAKTLTIQPWDKGTLGAIERAINAANLGYTPTNDGKLVRITVPPLTEERRREQVKLAHSMAEEARVAIRNQRRHHNEEIKKTEKKHETSEDDRERATKKVQELTDAHIKMVDKVLQAKEQELMEV